MDVLIRDVPAEFYFVSIFGLWFRSAETLLVEESASGSDVLDS